MWFSILMLVFTQIIMPIVFLANLVNSHPASQFELVVSTLVVVTYALFVFMVGRWDWFGYGLRFVLLLAVAIGVIASWYRGSLLPFWNGWDQEGNVENIVRIVLLLIFGFLLVRTIKGLRAPTNVVDFSFPLSCGTYYVAHGGSDASLNYHYNHPAQRFALDIVKLNAFGLRATGIYPSMLERFEIYDDPVYSPVDGMVLKAVSELPDLNPPERDTVARAGNHVVIQPAGMECYVLLAHLKNGSVRVREGDTVHSGQLLGLIGNSGNTTEPHLHIHCATMADEDFLNGGNGVPILFDGHYLRRNSLVRTKKNQTETRGADEQCGQPEPPMTRDLKS